MKSGSSEGASGSPVLALSDLLDLDAAFRADTLFSAGFLAKADDPFHVCGAPSGGTSARPFGHWPYSRGFAGYATATDRKAFGLTGSVRMEFLANLESEAGAIRPPA